MKPRIGDLFIVLGVIALAVGIWLYPWLSEEKGSVVIISQDGAVVSEVSLEKTEEIRLRGCTVRVENGEAFVSESTCPDLVCQKSGGISESGETVICVPNRVKLEIAGAREFDAIAG